MSRLLIVFCFFCFYISIAQEKKTIVTLEEFIGYVKKFHPTVKQAQLTISESEAKLLMARGAFDPKIEVDYANKNFKNTEYYDQLNATFKVPTWYGIELKANYENNEGNYVNPETKTPLDGLYNAGISVPVARDLLLNKRMAALQQAKLYLKQAQAKQRVEVNDILFHAINSYFHWLQTFQSKTIYRDYVENAKIRFDNVKKSYIAGEMAAVDTLEAGINVQNRKLDYEKAKIVYIKSSLALSNYLWLENNIPLELQENAVPDEDTINKIDAILDSSLATNKDDLLLKHPKLQELEIKKKILTIDKRLKTNNLLPYIQLEYNFLSSNYNNLNTWNTQNYKYGFQVSFPLFLRKERGDLKLAKIKLQDIDFDLSVTKLQLKNKIDAITQEISSYAIQYELLLKLVGDYEQLVKNEERKFILGEGSLFLVNFRESKLIETQLKKIETQNIIFNNKSELLRTLNLL